MTRPRCVKCGGSDGYIPLPHGRICVGCKRRTHYHPTICPGCGDVRPLGYRDQNERAVCASCAGQEFSIFACPGCGREDHPYGSTRCARCILRERLTVLLTDPGTGVIAAPLRPVFDTLMASERPQTTIYWLRRPPGIGPRLLRAMVLGQMEISHAAFEALPSDRAHNYLRDLLAAVGVLPPYEPAIARMTPWLEAKLKTLPAEEARLVNRFARWRVLRRLRGHAERGALTKAIDRGRVEITEAVRFLGWARHHGATIDTVSQGMIDRYFHAHLSKIDALGTFLNWLPARSAGLELELPSHRQAPPMAGRLGRGPLEQRRTPPA